MKVKKHEADEPTNEAVAIVEDNAMVPTNDILSMVENDSPSSFTVPKQFLTFFEYGGVVGYKAFLAWAMDTGNYIQGDLAVWHWADICRLFQDAYYGIEVLCIIQNNEYAIIVTEGIGIQLIRVFKVRIEVLKKELDKQSQLDSRVGNSL